MSLIRAKIAQDKPICEQLETEQIALKNTMLLTKDAQIKVVQDVEQYKTERNALTKRKVCHHLAKLITETGRSYLK
jgi:kinetochore protein Nuf2